MEPPVPSICKGKDSNNERVVYTDIADKDNIDEEYPLETKSYWLNDGTSGSRVAAAQAGYISVEPVNSCNLNSGVASIDSVDTNVSKATASPMISLLLLKDFLGAEHGMVCLQSLQPESASSNNCGDNFSNIFAVAQANLVAQTQHDIAMQLVEQDEGQTRTGELDNSKVGQSLTDDGSCRNVLMNHDMGQTKQQKLQDASRKSQSCDKTDAHPVAETCGMMKIEESVAIPLKKLTKVESLRCDFEGCERSFTYRAHLKYHRLTHSNDRRYHCDVLGCGQSFFTAQRLKVHAQTHSGARPFLCKECDKGFTTAGNLKNHMRTHSGDRPYSCTFEGCEKAFAEYSTLQKHIRTHTGEKPFQCMFCPKSFTQSSSRSQHMKKHFLVEKERWVEEAGDDTRVAAEDQVDSRISEMDNGTGFRVSEGKREKGEARDPPPETRTAGMENGTGQTGENGYTSEVQLDPATIETGTSPGEEVNVYLQPFSDGRTILQSDNLSSTVEYVQQNQTTGTNRLHGFGQNVDFDSIEKAKQKTGAIDIRRSTEDGDVNDGEIGAVHDISHPVNSSMKLTLTDHVYAVKS